MSYRVEFHASALAQLKGLQSEAFDALVERATDLVDAPWEAQALYADDPHFRQALFGEFGLMSFYIDDKTETIRIYNITWVGWQGTSYPGAPTASSELLPPAVPPQVPNGYCGLGGTGVSCPIGVVRLDD